ncbi:MAG TPA: NAD(P)-dependent alcohol dehydrogenase [Chthoniobacterales bacterium]|nr:NAD(P)-dependent alcohol dehydrogenase [Chthoniobacterales bacterium]
MKIRRVIKWTFGVVFFGLVLWLFVAYWTSTNDCNVRSALTHPMKAVRYCEYGPPDVLKVDVIEKPVPNDDELLIRVRAASVNAADGHKLRGGFISRPFTGMRKPKNTRAGTDYAGVVEVVGRNVKDFKPGDDVFGGRNGALAEYVCARADRAVVVKPANISFEQAGSVAIAGLTALQGLRDTGHLKAGQKVLINGASGGVGTFAVQIAKALGAEVTAVCSTKNVELVRSLGADRVIDYTKENFTEGDQRYDVIFDLVNNHSYSDRRRVLNPGGICVMAGIGGSGWHEETFSRLAGELNAYLRSRFTKEKFVSYLANLNKQDLGVLRELMETGKVVPAVTKTYPLTETVAAYKYLETGHARGKVAITID